MTQYPSVAAGQRVTGALLQSMLPITSLVTADQSVNSGSTGTTLVNATNLSASLAASADYQGRLLLLSVSGTTGDLKIAWTLPSGAVGFYGLLGPDTTAAASNLTVMEDVAGTSLTSSVSIGGTTQQKLVVVEISVQTTNAGTLQLQFAQQTSDATNTTVKAGSRLMLWRVG